MKLVLRTATIGDIYALGEDLSEISKAELQMIFGENWWSAIAQVKQFLKAGPADVLLMDGKPICALGHMPHSVYTSDRVTWFLAAAAYFNLGARGVIYGRNYMKMLQRNYPGINFYSYSKSPHPHVARWFRLCGYVKTADGYVLPVQPQSDKTIGTRA